MSAGMGNDRTLAKAKLTNLIERVMADGKVDPAEREEMQGFYRQALVTVSDMKEVLSGYLRNVQNEVLADGKVTDQERARCRAVVSELKIPPALVPDEFKALL
jgi:uncharacterized tellurite resistance protein B-like protein